MKNTFAGETDDMLTRVATRPRGTLKAVLFTAELFQYDDEG